MAPDKSGSNEAFARAPPRAEVGDLVAWHDTFQTFMAFGFVTKRSQAGVWVMWSDGTSFDYSRDFFIRSAVGSIEIVLEAP